METRIEIGSKAFTVLQGDLTEARVDAIVNAANEQLLHGGGVAGAIARKGGPVIQEESRRLAPVPTGGAVITSGGALEARYVIHAVGPRGGQPDADRLLASAVRSSLALAEERGLRSIAFPAISTGIFGYPLASCARILTGEALAWLRERDHALEEIRVVLFDAEAYRAFAEELSRLDG